jgi:hypothetical protein
MSSSNQRGANAPFFYALESEAAPGMKLYRGNNKNPVNLCTRPKPDKNAIFYPGQVLLSATPRR